MSPERRWSTELSAEGKKDRKMRKGRRVGEESIIMKGRVISARNMSPLIHSSNSIQAGEERNGKGVVFTFVRNY
jgi:hypothetical protein